jgi:hypothetical protein
MSGVLHHRIRQSEEVLHTALHGVRVSPIAPTVLLVAILVVCLLFCSQAT